MGFRFPRGPKNKIPTLDNGRAAWASDNGVLVVGGPDGNIELASQPYVDTLAELPWVETFTASEGQTIITLGHAYAHGALTVEIDNVPQTLGEGYTEIDSTSFAISEPLMAGQVVKVTINKRAYQYSEMITSQLNSLTEKAKKINNFWINVQEYEAKGDGVTDDTPAFNAAIAALKTLGGGRLFVPKTDSFYLLKDGVTLCDNLYIFSNGAILKKNALCNTYYVFQSLSGTKTGYGSGVTNVIIEGLQVSGSFADSKGASFTLHHGKNVLIRNCTFVETIISGHPIDLGGCSDVIIDNCWFFGYKPVVGREYVEAIQLDHSTAEGNGGMDVSYDGLPTKNVTVQNCKFLPLTINGTKYNAPNPLGSHSRVDGQWFTNIKFLNNYVEDAPVAATSDGQGGLPYAVGWLHFYHMDGLEIIGNSFINTQEYSARILGLYTLDTAILMSDVNVLSPTKKAYTSMPCKNIKFERNKVKGFSNQTNTSLIYLQGKNYSNVLYFVENVKVNKNEFIDCFNLGGSATYNICSDVISGDYVKGLKVEGNHGSNIRRLLYLTNSKKIKFHDNDLINVYWNPVNINTSDIITALNNTLDGCGAGFYFNTCNKLTVKHNAVINDNPSALSTYGDIFAFKTCTRLTVKDNDLDGITNSQYISIHLYTVCDNGKVKDNFITGFLPQSISGDSTNIITA